MRRVIILFLLCAHWCLANAQIPTVSIVTDKAFICPGIANNFFATVTNATAAVQYQWQVNGANRGPNNSIFSSSTLNDGDKITCVVNNTGDPAYPSINSNTITAIGSSTEAPSMIVTQTAFNSCSATFQATVIDAGAAPSYRWTVNGVNQHVNASTLVYNNPVVNDKVTCVVTNTTTCSLFNTDTKSVTISGAKTSAKLTIAAIPGVEGCDDKPIVFRVSSTPVTSGVQYDWYQNGTYKGMITSTKEDISFTLHDGDIIQCKIEHPDPCVANSQLVSNEVKVSVDHQPTISITSDKSSVCVGTPVTFTATVKPLKNPDYQWKVNGDVIAGEHAEKFITAMLKDGDEVTCTVVNTSPCKAPVTSNAIAITVYAVPVITLPEVINIALGQSVQLNPLITGNAVSYQWSPAMDLSNAFIANPIAKPSVTTTYQLTATSAGGCTTTASVKVKVNFVINPVNVFTPNGDGINDTWNIPELSAFADCAVNVFNRQGQIIFHSVGYTKPWDGTLNGTPVAVGTYYYVIDTKRSLNKFAGTLTLVR